MTALERDAVIHAFLSDGLIRLSSDPSTERVWAARVEGVDGGVEAKLADAYDWCATSLFFCGLGE